MTKNRTTHKAVLAVLLAVDLLCLTNHASDKLVTVNINIRNFLDHFNPITVIQNFQTAQKYRNAHCWLTTKYTYHDNYIYCERDGPEAVDQLLDKQFPNITADHKNQLRVILCKNNGIGCRNRNRADWPWFYVGMSYVELAQDGVLSSFARAPSLAFISWLVGFVIGLRLKIHWFICLWLGMIIGSVPILALLWSLEALTSILGYAFGLVAWFNGWIGGGGALVIWLREMWKLRQEAVEVRSEARELQRRS